METLLRLTIPLVIQTNFTEDSNTPATVFGVNLYAPQL